MQGFHSCEFDLQSLCHSSFLWVMRSRASFFYPSHGSFRNPTLRRQNKGMNGGSNFFSFSYCHCYWQVLLVIGNLGFAITNVTNALPGVASPPGGPFINLFLHIYMEFITLYST